MRPACWRREQPRTGKPQSCWDHSDIDQRRGTDRFLRGLSPASLAGRYKVNLLWITSALLFKPSCCLVDVLCRTCRARLPNGGCCGWRGLKGFHFLSSVLGKELVPCSTRSPIYVLKAVFLICETRTGPSQKAVPASEVPPLSKCQVQPVPVHGLGPWKSISSGRRCLILC